MGDRFFRLEAQSLISRFRSDQELVLAVHLSTEHLLAQGILEEFLDRPLQRSGTELGIVSLIQYELLSLDGYLEIDTFISSDADDGSVRDAIAKFAGNANIPVEDVDDDIPF